MPVTLLSGVGGSLDLRGLSSRGSVGEMGLIPQPASPAPTGTFFLSTLDILLSFQINIKEQ